MNTDYKKETLSSVIEVPKDDLDWWESLLLSDDVDYEANGFAKYACVWWKTAKFPDGCEVDVKVCTDSDEDRDVWSEAVLFDENGCQLACTEVCDTLRGEWELEWFDRKANTMHVYNVKIVDAKEGN